MRSISLKLVLIIIGSTISSIVYCQSDNQKTQVNSDFPTTKYFAIGLGGSYGGLGVKLGRFQQKNDHYQAEYIIAGLGGYEQNEEYSLGVVASVGKKFYFPDKLFVDCRGGIQDYTFVKSKLRPVLGARVTGGIELRSNWIGISFGAGISQNLIFDNSTVPVIEIGLIFGNLKPLKKD